jgi:hypothetical protein
MSSQQIDSAEWTGFFDTFSKLLIGRRAEVEVASLDIGDQIEAEWLPLIGITYDRKNDLVEVALQGLDHLIQGPREIYVDFDIGGLTGLEIIDADGTRQIIKLKEALALPPPEPAKREPAQ